MFRKGIFPSTKTLFHTFLRNLNIKVRDTPNPNFLKFVLEEKVVMKEGTMDFSSQKYSNISPLAQALFSLDGVTRVFYGQNHISVGKKEEVDWEGLESEVKSVIEEFFIKGQPLFSEEQKFENSQIKEDDSEIVQMIKEILETRVRPLVQEDGGDIIFKDFNEQTGVVNLLMKGSCAGCPSSGQTLKGGIERMLCHYIPEVTSVEAEDFEG